MKAHKILLIILLILPISAFCQEQQQQIKKESPVFYGGNLGFNVSSNQWLINVSPMVGYKFTPSIHGGISLVYQHESSSKHDYKINSYGGGAFLRYDLSNTVMKSLPFGIYFQADYEGTQNDFKYNSRVNNNNNSNYSEFINRLYLGAGYKQKVSARSSIFLSVSVDVLNLDKDRDVLPVIRGGFIF